uniref:hypothetical protein n=1 Tax=Yersinia frederiksenii TaxID=29484 RepID=UPI001F4BF810|nr:hypothetical protein [Yersinia frederiksenii]ULG20002.1 hypothetical protein 49p1_00304 [Yersinia frederiksenii]
MQTLLIKLPIFTELVKTGGVDEFGVVEQQGKFHVFAVNKVKNISYFLQEARGDYRSWTSLQRVHLFLTNLGINEYQVRMLA